MPDTEVAVTELLEIDPDRVDAVTSPANGTEWLILKAIDDTEAVVTTDDVIAEITKTEEREKCDACDGVAKSGEPCKKCFGTGLLPHLGETPSELIEAAKATAPSGAPVPVRDSCPTCKGTGFSEPGTVRQTKCVDCDGTGKDSTMPPSDKLSRVDADGHHIREGDAKGREAVDKSTIELCEDDDCDVCKELDGEELEKAKLKAKARNALPGSAFALPGRRYPINDINHARNALARVAQNGTDDEKAKVRAAVHSRYPEIDSATKGDGSTFTAPNAALEAMAQKVGGDDADNDPKSPGSPAWEACDAQIAADAATALMAAAELIRQFKDRENQEVAAGEGNDIYDAFDASQALCAVNDALGIMARMAFHEGLEAAKSLEDDEIAEKAGRRLSRKSVQSLADLRDHITTLLGDDDPSKTNDNNDETTKSVEIDMDALSKEIENMEVDELTKWADARDEKLVGTVATAVAEALKGSMDVKNTESIGNAKNANNKAKRKKPKADNTALEDEAMQGTNDSASSHATGAAKSEGDDDVTTETEDGNEVDTAEKAELTPEEIEARDERKAAKKALKAAKRAEKEVATNAAMTKAIEEATSEVRKSNEVLQERLAQVEKMAQPSTIVRTAPADAQIAAKARDEREMRITALEQKARDTNDPDVKKAAREEARELRAEGVAS